LAVSGSAGGREESVGEALGARAAALAEDAAAVALAARIGRGDAGAEAELVERYSRGVRLMLRRLVRDPALAEDLHQGTFRVVLERLRGAGLADPAKLPAFFQRTARNLFLGAWRKSARRGEQAVAEPAESAPDPQPGQLEELLHAERRATVRQLIEELPTERDRQILLRYYAAEQDKARICAELDLSAQHFDRVLFRARGRLRELLARARATGRVR
jgi:RNA polymerase sigma-70 factor (ECF subfamily)